MVENGEKSWLNGGDMVKPISLSRDAYSMNEDVLLGQRLFGSLPMAQLFRALGTLAAAVQRRSRAEAKRLLRL